MTRTPRKHDAAATNSFLSWTPAEDLVLEEMASIYTTRQIAKRLGRTPDAVRMRAYFLEITMCRSQAGAKLDNLQVAILKAVLDAGFTPKQIMAAFELEHITEGALRHIRTGRRKALPFTESYYGT